MKLKFIFLFFIFLLVLISCRKEIKSEKGGIDIISNVYFDASKGLSKMQSFHLSRMNYSGELMIELVPDLEFPEITTASYFIKDSVFYDLKERYSASILTDIQKKQKPTSVYDKTEGAVFTKELLLNYRNRRKLSDTILFKKKYNLNQQNETIEIEGNVEIKKFSENICNTFVNFITLNNNIKFSNITRINDNNLTSSSIRYEGNSLNGYNINIKNLNQNLPDLPLGTYSFSNNSTTEKIEFRKYVGLPKSFSTSIIIPSDWILYETQGSFTIVEKTLINGFKVVKIKLNFTASHNGIVEYTINNADFITAY